MNGPNRIEVNWNGLNGAEVDRSEPKWIEIDQSRQNRTNSTEVD